MSEFDRITLRQDDTTQTRGPCGNDSACLVTASSDLPGQSTPFAHYMLPAPFARSGSLRVQWDATTLARRRFTQDA
jgi:hypothetical protein